jgi:hypothetical protein
MAEESSLLDCLHQIRRKCSRAWIEDVYKALCILPQFAFHLCLLISFKGIFTF